MLRERERGGNGEGSGIHLSFHLHTCMTGLSLIFITPLETLAMKQIFRRQQCVIIEKGYRRHMALSPKA